jgi:hypothetical protein
MSILDKVIWKPGSNASFVFIIVVTIITFLLVWILKP